MALYIIGIGSNEGREEHMALARKALRTRFPDIRFSQERLTEPLHLHRPERFANQVAGFYSTCTPAEVKQCLKEIEQIAGRKPEDKQREVIKLDLDLLQCDHLLFKPEEMTRDYIRKGIEELINHQPKMNYLGIIPARYASTRFPAKPLAILGGKPVIQRVYEQVKGVLDEVYVATDDERIATVVKSFGGHVVMTSPHHKSGTDRCQEACAKIGGNFDVVVNIQGDEPFIQPSQLQAIKACFEDERTEIATLVKPFTADDEWAALENVNSPKVVINQRQEAMYFSRSIIPYQRNAEKRDWLKNHTYYKHIGLYAYRTEVLQAITALPQSSLEIAESLEQLRWLQHGYTIKVGISEVETIGIDTPQDLARAEEFLKQLNA